MKLRVPPRRAVAVAIGTLAVAYFVFWACAPTATLPPPVPFAADEKGEFSLGVVAGGPNEIAAVVPGAQFSYTWHFEPGVDLGLHAWAGLHGMVGAGINLRWLPNPKRKFAIGLAGQGGWLYANAGLPMSWRVGKNTWIWTQPTLGYDATGAVASPSASASG